MEENQISHTAMMNAYARAYHSKYDNPKIFDDFLAYHLIPDKIRANIEQSLAKSLQLYDPERSVSCPDQMTALAYSMRAIAGPAVILSRARYTEDILDKAVRQGVKQYVILGAGMDTFAFRRPELLEQLQVFEVDHPATQAFKRRRLAELGWEQPAQLHFIPIDFTKECLEAVLARSSYDSRVPSCFSWLGVTYYLTYDAVFSTLGAIADVATAGSMVIFEYYDTDAFVPVKVAKRVKLGIDGVQRLGEPMMNKGFDPSMLAANLARLGLRLHENLSPADIEEQYFKGRTDGYHANEHAHFACAAVG